MSALLDVYLKKDTIAILLDTLQKKGEKGVSITVAVNDNTNQYGQNVSAYVSQTKEEREAKKNRFFVGSGQVYYVSDDGVKKAEKRQQEQQQQNQSSTDKLPF